MGGEGQTILTEPQVGSFAAGGTTVILSKFGRLDVFGTPGLASTPTLTANLRLGGSIAFTMRAGMAPTFDGRVFTSVNIAPAAAAILWALVPQDQPFNTWGGPTSAAIASVSISGQPITTQIVDSTTNTLNVPWTNGSSAPATGVLRIIFTANNAVTVTLTDGTTTKNVQAADGASWFGQTLEFAVVAGTTYTFAGTGLAILGSKGVITPG